MPTEIHHVINGEYVKSESGETFHVYNPATEEHFLTVSRGGEPELEKAVEAAETAFQEWKRQSSTVKSRTLRKYAEIIGKHAAEFAKLEAQSIGVPTSVYDDFSGGAVAALEHNASLAAVNQGISSLNTPGHVNFTMKQPFGIVAAILPCPLESICSVIANHKVATGNAPLPMFANKVGPAVAAGNAVIVKTSEKAPATSALAAKLAVEAGFPKGLIQVIHGEGATGALICAHPKIRKVSFTGSVPTGKKVAAACIPTLKNTTLELGGKSPALVFEDADLELATNALVASIFRNSGQICAAQSRLYVHESIKDKFLELYQKKWETRIVHGDPLETRTTQGPMADKMQFDQVSKFIDVGKKEGKLVFGGKRAGTNGFFIQPTLFTGMSADATLNTAEIFGPVVVVRDLSASSIIDTDSGLQLHTFKSEAEVLKRANNSEFGLSSSVFTRDVNRALRIAEGLEAGNVSVNAPNLIAFDMPFGGWKQSGIGREVGCTAMEPYLEIKVSPLPSNCRVR